MRVKHNDATLQYMLDVFFIEYCYKYFSKNKFGRAVQKIVDGDDYEDMRSQYKFTCERLRTTLSSQHSIQNVEEIHKLLSEAEKFYEVL